MQIVKLVQRNTNVQLSAGFERNRQTDDRIDKRNNIRRLYHGTICCAQFHVEEMKRAQHGYAKRLARIFPTFGRSVVPRIENANHRFFVVGDAQCGPYAVFTLYVYRSPHGIGFVTSTAEVVQSALDEGFENAIGPPAAVPWKAAPLLNPCER